MIDRCVQPQLGYSAGRRDSDQAADEQTERRAAAMIAKPSSNRRA
jgi:hypothetical protein